VLDSHAHLNAPGVREDLAGILDRAEKAGITGIVAIGSGYGVEEMASALALTDSYPNLYPTVGIHPHEAEKADKEAHEELARLARNPRVVAIGECGLDFARGRARFKKEQEEVFRFQCELALTVNKPLIVHTRDAFSETHAILKEYRIGHRVGGVVHFFTGTAEEGRAYIQEGMKLGIPGVVTFPKADPLRQALGEIRVEDLLLETDTPFAAPVPYRGKPNEPAYVVEVAREIARIKGLTLEDVDRVTEVTTRKLFRLPDPRKPRIAYTIRNATYLNITNRCTLRCVFCPKFKDYEVKGYYLELPEEPEFYQILSALEEENWRIRDEVVFCGYGEPTQRLPLLIEVARYLKSQGARRIRLNTDGLSNLIHGRNIVTELQGLVDAVSISLNAPDPETYARLCPNPYGKDAYPHVLSFIRACVGVIPEVVATVVGVPRLDVERCRQIAEGLGAVFRYRPLNEVG
jgi:TatD DNase family protein